MPEGRWARKTAREGQPPVRGILRLQRVLSDLRTILRPRNINSAVYSVMTAAFLGLGGAYIWASPEVVTRIMTHANTPDALVLWRSIGSALLVLPAWGVTLKVLAAPPMRRISLRLSSCPGVCYDALSASTPIPQRSLTASASFSRERADEGGLCSAILHVLMSVQWHGMENHDAERGSPTAGGS